MGSACCHRLFSMSASRPFDQSASRNAREPIPIRIAPKAAGRSRTGPLDEQRARRTAVRRRNAVFRLIMGAAMLALVAPSVAAQTAPTVAPAPDPARLAIAQRLIEKFMPADRRDAMVEQMIRPMVENMRETMTRGPMFEAINAKDPKFTATFDLFLESELEHSIATTKAAMPAMAEAMARAYARRFTLDQLQALETFFDTPAGRAYAEQAPTIMSDPDILAAQRAMMIDAMAGMQQRLGAFAAKVTAGAKKGDND